MKSRLPITGILVLTVVAAVFLSGCATGGPGAGGQPCQTSPGEWVPAQGECPGSDAETQQKCNAFCDAHPDCCGERGPPGGQTTLPLPSGAEVAALTRSYPTTIKAIDEGPMIYSQNGPATVISDATLAEMKDIGFNTVQIMIIGSRADNGTIVFNEQNNAVLLNDIVAIKKAGMAAWVVLDMSGYGSGGATAGRYASYPDFKAAYGNLVRLSAPLLEKYKVEYFTPCNEQDKYFNEQTGWGTAAQVDGYLMDFYPAMNGDARLTFGGKLISKMTQPAKRDPAVTAVMIASADIAGVDVGPYIGESRSMESYAEDMGDYQLYATAAAAKGVPWMNAEYWQGDFFADYPAYVRENQLAFANVSFSSYLAATPRGVGYTWNDFSTFSLQPQGESTRLAIKAFFEKV
jgi:hypothetical protein